MARYWPDDDNEYLRSYDNEDEDIDIVLIPPTPGEPPVDARFAKVVDHLGAYAEAQRLVANARSLCIDTIRAWLKVQPYPEASRTWLVSQPLAMLGITVPQEVLDALAPVPVATPGHEDAIPF